MKIKLNLIELYYVLIYRNQKYYIHYHHDTGKGISVTYGPENKVIELQYNGFSIGSKKSKYVIYLQKLSENEIINIQKLKLLSIYRTDLEIEKKSIEKEIENCYKINGFCHNRQEGSYARVAKKMMSLQDKEIEVISKLKEINQEIRAAYQQIGEIR